MQVPFKICREVDSQDLRRFDSRQLLILDEQRGELRFFFAKETMKSLHLERFSFMSFSAHQASMTDCRLPWLSLLRISDKDVSSTDGLEGWQDELYKGSVCP